MSKFDAIEKELESKNKERLVEYATASSWKWIFEPLLQKDELVPEFYKSWFESYKIALDGLVISRIFEENHEHKRK